MVTSLPAAEVLYEAVFRPLMAREVDPLVANEAMDTTHRPRCASDRVSDYKRSSATQDSAPHGSPGKACPALPSLASESETARLWAVRGLLLRYVYI